MSQQQQEAQSIQFMIQRLFLKDASFETPNAPAVFQQKWEPQLQLDVHTEHNTLETNVYEVMVTVTATVRNQNATAFLIEVKQSGIFTIECPDKAQLDHLLGSYCPSILFPYAREVVTSLASHGSFPQLVLAPVNFDAMYMQKTQEKQGEEANAH